MVGMSKARRVFGARWKAIAIAGIVCGGCLAVSPASAFEIFGFRFFESESEAPAAPVPDPLPYTATLSVSGGDDGLEEALSGISQLVQDQESPPSGAPGLISRALADQQQLLARLYVAGRYGGTVEITLAGVPLEQAAETGEFPRSAGRPVPVTVRIETGPEFQFGDLSLERLAADGMPAGPLDANTYGLVSGLPALSDKILEAENRIVSDLKAEGHPLARIAERSVVADHARQRLDVTIVADPGPLAEFGDIAVKGAERTETDFIVSQSLIEPGTRYDPQVLRKAAKRLRALGIFGSVRVIEGEALDAANRLPVTIEVSERKRRVIGGGANISSVDGIGAEIYWRHRNLFGRGEQLSLEGSVGRVTNGSPEDLEYAARVVFTKPGAFGPTTTFTSTVGAKREKPDSYDSRSVYGSMKVSKEVTETLQTAVGTEFSYAREDDALGSGNYALFGIFGEVTHDSRDDLLDPTEGFRASLFAEPAYDAETGGVMLFTRGSASAYRAIDEARRFVLAGRVAAGSVFGANQLDIPPSRRYYVGGGGSVRGYAYRNVGPRVGGDVVGGRSFVEGSAEVRARLTDTIGAVVFADAGAAYVSEIPDFSEPLKVGVGVGLRYYSALGPLRFDFAVPLQPDSGDPDFAIYVGLSQAF